MVNVSAVCNGKPNPNKERAFITLIGTCNGFFFFCQEVIQPPACHSIPLEGTHAHISHLYCRPSSASTHIPPSKRLLAIVLRSSLSQRLEIPLHQRSCSAIGHCIGTLALDCLLWNCAIGTVTVYSHGYWRMTVTSPSRPQGGARISTLMLEALPY